MSLLVSPVLPSGAVVGNNNAGVQVSFTITPLPGEKVSDLCRRLARQLHEREAVPLHLLVFGKLQANQALQDALGSYFDSVDWPITYVEGEDCHQHPIAGLQVHAFTGEVERVRFGRRVVGSVYTDGGARQCLVGGLSPVAVSLSPAEQTRRALNDLETIFAGVGFTLADVVRTWFYLDNILAWYDDFNRARTGKYSGVKFCTGSLPASTGVGAKNPAGSALAMAALAFRPLQKNAYAEEVASPLQCPAPAYGSAFSRAMEVTTNAGRRLHISGTASIAPGGKTLWVGDMRRQVELTMEVVGAILHSRGLTFAELTRATAYFRHAENAGVFGDWLTANQLTQMPVVFAQCDVCRDDLLFELEAEADTNNPGMGVVSAG